MPRRLLILLTIAGFATGGSIEFNRDIRPILSERCFTCHGPDESKRTSKLRLDTEAGANADLGGRAAIVPGSAARSELVRRITANDARRMPPSWSGAAKLADREIALLSQWIDEGAVWQKHWSFRPPKKPAVSDVSDPKWMRNPIDSFVLARLDQEGLRPSRPADPRTLLRRVSFDLTGLPPTPQEVAAFSADGSSQAYEKAVDRLLSSSRYGERMAFRWLEAARYADTNGYQTDAARSMWRWRDWVIEVFNRNMPFDQFTVEQIAGDLLPNATTDQKVATGFNRNHRGNGEGGIIAEEYAVEYVVDRVETTSTVWMGLTLGCARCHSHKYDPFTQKEFYQLFAYFNNVPERGKAFKYGNSPPVVRAPSPEEARRGQELERRLASARKRLADLEPEIAKAQSAWESGLATSTGQHWAPTRDLLVHLPLDGSANGHSYASHVSRNIDQPDHQPPLAGDGRFTSIEARTGPADPPEPEQLADSPSRPDSDVRAKSLEAVWRDGAGGYSSGVVGQAAAFDGKRYLEINTGPKFEVYDSFSIGAWIRPLASSGALVSRIKDEPEGQGLVLFLDGGRLAVSMNQRWLDDGIRIETEAKVPLERWSHVMLTYDGSRLASGLNLYLNGERQMLRVPLDDLNQSISASQPWRIGSGLGAANRFRGEMDELRIYRTAMSAGEAAVLATRESLNELARVRKAQRSRPQAAKLRSAFLSEYGPAMLQDAQRQVLDLTDDLARWEQSLPTVMVMEESSVPRATHLLIRGAYDRPGEKVEPGVPAALPAMAKVLPNNRLGFARWLVAESNPLTARVAVNRFWQMLFGTGLVKTSEDFGSQGEWPSHPELLDWLATEFVRSGWDVKALLKAMVTSATYRQSSQVTPELLAKDPENRLLARGPRMRLRPEMVRDQALAAAGLLVEKVGGPSVKPYQPPGLWRELTGGADYRADKGEGLYRRSLYTFWKRTSPPPMMMNFDAAGREVCVVREGVTNTPLQALNLMNDVQFLEAARFLGQRMMREGGETVRERIAFGFQLATARRPEEREAEILQSSWNYYRDLYQTDSAAAAKYLSQGEKRHDPNLSASELAAYATVASLILNLDATVTKE